MAGYLLPALLIVVGLGVLLAGGEVLVRGASGLATAFRVSPLVIGLTVVAFGTSAPELAVVLQSSFAGQTDLAIGNVVGSCIFNVLVVLGLTAVVLPVVVSARLVRLEVPLMIASSVLLLLFGLDGVLGWLDGLVLFAGLAGYMVWTVWQSRRESVRFQGEFEGAIETRAGVGQRHAAWNVAVLSGLVIGGLVLLVLGSKWLVNGSVAIARLLQISELMIGLTIVAVGTSLPEIVTSILATLRGQSEIAVGNVVGSNIFNILAVLGFSSIVAPGGIEVSRDALSLDIPVMIAVAVACLPIFFTQHRIDRWEGYLFLGYYVAYTVYLILHATAPERGHTFALILLLFVVPLTTITLLIAGVRALPGGAGIGAILGWFARSRLSRNPSGKRAKAAARKREKWRRQRTEKDRKRQEKRRKKP
ncbi:MAG: calcium/sodium antiporter [Planctomycetota bacterium]